MKKLRVREVVWAAWVTKPVGGRMKIKFGSSEVQFALARSNQHAGSRSSQILSPSHEPGAEEAVVGMAAKLNRAPSQQPTS